jgi:hypothetical protein
MSEIALSYFRAHRGRFFEAVVRHLEAQDKAKAAIDDLAKEYQSTGAFYRQGARVLGLHFHRNNKPKGWRVVGPRGSGYAAPPDSLSTAGEKLRTIVLPIPELLAADIGLPPFFTCIHGSYCTMAYGFMVSGVAFGSFPRSLREEAKMLSPVMELIKRGPYFAALDVYEDYKP